MANHEERREFVPSVHMIMGINKSSNKANPPVIRRVIHRSVTEALLTFRPMLKTLGGEWRIHHTVNARDVEKARRHLLCNIIMHPEKANSIDIEWRTSLLQRHCIYGEKRWMLDIDTKDKDIINHLRHDLVVPYGKLITYIETPKGWHFIIKPFDTREICKLDYVTLLRDGYYYMETVGENK